MDKLNQLWPKILLWVVVMLCLLGITLPVQAQLDLTNEEKEFIAQNKNIKAAALKGTAPIQYLDTQNKVRGIVPAVLDIVAEKTGLIFEYRLYDSFDEAFEDGFDFLFGLSYNYLPEDFVLSIPFLKSETILYINEQINPNELANSIFAAVKGSALPQGVQNEKAIFFDTREEALEAVEKGRADYGFSNAYSLAFYTLQNDYRNIITIPTTKESREYGLGIPAGNTVLLGILNKALASIDDNVILTLVLEATSSMERKITPLMVMDNYGKEIVMVILTFIFILIGNLVLNIRAKRSIQVQYKRYVVLSNISNEYIYEYFVKNDHLDLSDKFVEFFGPGAVLMETTETLKKTLLNMETDELSEKIVLPLANGGQGVFRAVNSVIYDEKGHMYSIIGKLIDISEQIAEKEKLIVKAQVDGLTGIYNAKTSQELIIQNIQKRSENQMDVLMLMDCDNFKNINDGFGHLVGDRVLAQIAQTLKLLFRKTDIVGRVGGDEFCVYLADIPSTRFIEEKAQCINALVRDLNGDFSVSLSIGIAIVNRDESYEEVFRKADIAMYQAKEAGKAQYMIYPYN